MALPGGPGFCQQTDITDFAKLNVLVEEGQSCLYVDLHFQFFLGGPSDVPALSRELV